MIYYDSAGHGFHTLLRFHGSVAPKALAFALPCGVIGGLLCALRQEAFLGEPAPSESVQVGTFIAFNSILGFLVIFRTQNAYGRYWEGLSLVQRVRGDLLNALSHMFAFCSEAEHLRTEVDNMQLLMAKLGSLMFCTALRSVAVSHDVNYEIIDLEGLPPSQVAFLAKSNDGPTVIMHWIQRIVVKGMREKILDIPAPVLARVFHELSNSVVALHEAMKISDTPFPFAFAQMIAWMLATQLLVTPVICSSMTDNVYLAGGGTFIGIFLTFSMNLIASEIELPFGMDPNDLPLHEMQQTFNVSLLTLMHPQTQTTPVVAWSDRHLFSAPDRIESRYLGILKWLDCVEAAYEVNRAAGALREEPPNGAEPSGASSRSIGGQAATADLIQQASKYSCQKHKMLMRQGKLRKTGSTKSSLLSSATMKFMDLDANSHPATSSLPSGLLRQQAPMGLAETASEASSRLQDLQQDLGERDALRLSPRRASIKEDQSCDGSLQVAHTDPLSDDTWIVDT